MNAKNNDPDRIEEIYSLIQTLKQRISLFGITQESLLNPQDELAHVINENIHSLLYRITEEAHALSFSVQSQYPSIAWDDIRDFRNLLAHNYAKVGNFIIWDSITNDIPPLEQVCIDYCNENLIPLPSAQVLNEQEKQVAPVPEGMTEIRVGERVAQQPSQAPVTPAQNNEAAKRSADSQNKGISPPAKNLSADDITR